MPQAKTTSRSRTKAAEDKKDNKTEEGYEKETLGTGKVQRVILAAVTIEETRPDGGAATKIQVIRQGDKTVLQRSEDSQGSAALCHERATYDTDALTEAIGLVTSDDFKKKDDTKTKSKTLKLLRRNPTIEVEAASGSGNNLQFTRSDDVQVTVAGYELNFHDDDLKAIADLLSKKMEIRQSRGN